MLSYVRRALCEYITREILFSLAPFKTSDQKVLRATDRNGFKFQKRFRFFCSFEAYDSDVRTQTATHHRHSPPPLTTATHLPHRPASPIAMDSLWLSTSPKAPVVKRHVYVKSSSSFNDSYSTSCDADVKLPAGGGGQRPAGGPRLWLNSFHQKNFETFPSSADEKSASFFVKAEGKDEFQGLYDGASCFSPASGAYINNGFTGLHT
jgi:hypothetical protein